MEKLKSYYRYAASCISDVTISVYVLLLVWSALTWLTYRFGVAPNTILLVAIGLVAIAATYGELREGPYVGWREREEPRQ